MKDFKLVDETLAYVTAEDATNTSEKYLTTGSKNVLIDRQRKVVTAGGFTRLGAASSTLTPIRSAATWNTSSGSELPLRMYDDELEVYLGTIDETVINAWTRVKDAWSTTEIMRFAVWWDTTENIDLLLFVQGDDNIYEWNGAVAVVSSVTGTTITKAGTTTFAQSRFYTTRDKTIVCVRTGTEYTYTGGESSVTLTGIADTTGIIAGDILVQKIVTATDKPAANRTNHTIWVHENQVCLGSEDDKEGFISQNDDYDDFTYSSPRTAGQGGLLTLSDTIRAFGSLSQKLVIFAGRSSIFTAEYREIAVGSTLAETLQVKKLKTGVDQSAVNQECVTPVGNSLAYISFENALRMLDQPEDIEGPQLKTLSNPIKPDFDAEVFTVACQIWYKNALYISTPSSSKLYVLEFIEDADGKLRRHWQPPQEKPVRALSIIGGLLHGHSNSVPETYILFNGLSNVTYNVDTALDDKVPIHAKAVFAYRTFGKRALLKCFDEHYSEGDISASTRELQLTLEYDFGGATGSVEKLIDGDDSDIIYETVQRSGLGQAALGSQPLGGSLEELPDANRYRVIFELPKEDFHELRETYETNDVDQYWSVIARGPNARLSPRQNTSIKK